MSNATSGTILSTQSNVASTKSNVASTLLLEWTGLYAYEALYTVLPKDETVIHDISDSSQYLLRGIGYNIVWSEIHESINQSINQSIIGLLNS